MSLDVPIDFPREIGSVIEGLREARLEWRAGHDRNAEHGVRFPSRGALKRILRELSAAIFPLRLGPPELTAANENAWVDATLETTLDQLAAQIVLELDLANPEARERAAAEHAIATTGTLAGRLPAIRRLLDSDVEAAYRADPAARSVNEVLLHYPSIAAVIPYRIAHELHRESAPIVARTITEIAHQRTGIDIHPGAHIGPGLFIDHGTGVVIGETAVLGSDVHLHQGVTLGGARPARDGLRHPRVGNGVVIHPGAVLLGPIDVGDGSVIDANVVLRQDVPPRTFVRAPAPLIEPA
ncbi:serine acetyltransferase [Nostoc sp. 3335mG]|nr:serine acetyltransferase [Nostoc sp. 3335mG]